MNTLALAFMLASWSFVLGLTAWAFHRVLRSRTSRGAGPADDADRDDAGGT